MGRDIRQSRKSVNEGKKNMTRIILVNLQVQPFTSSEPIMSTLM